MYKGVFSIFRRYWRAYGGVGALVTSFYLHFALVLSLVCANEWLSKDWWVQVAAVLPNLLGFTLGGFAIFIGFGDDSFRRRLVLPDQGRDDGPTPYVTLCAAFVHFIVVQVFALLFAIVVSALRFDWLGAPNCFLVALPYLNAAAGFVGYVLFLYSLTSALAATFHVFRIAAMYETFQRVEDEQKKP